MKTKPTSIIAGFLAAGLFVACQTPDKTRSDLQLTGTGPAAQHAVHSEQLKKVMWDLTLAPAARLPQELDVEKEQKWRRSDAVRILKEMAASAEGIPSVLAEVKLSADQEKLFRQLAGNLKADALRLHDDVAKLTPDEIGNRFNALQDNCIACHHRFRVLPLIDVEE